MKYSDYLAQDAQEQPAEEQAQQAQPATLEMLATRLAAEKFYSLQAEAREAIETEADPSALAALLTVAIFGADSPEAGTVAEAVAKARRPGGYEYAITMAEQRKTMLKKQLKRLAELQKDLTAQAAQAETETWQLRASASDEGQANWGLLSVITFLRDAEGADAGTVLEQAAGLYEKHHGNREAMGLLCGSLSEWTARASAGGLSLICYNSRVCGSSRAK